MSLRINIALPGSCRLGVKSLGLGAAQVGMCRNRLQQPTPWIG